MVTLVHQKVCQTHFCHAHVIPSASTQLPTFSLQNDDAEGQDEHTMGVQPAQRCLKHWHKMKLGGNGWPNWFDGCVTQLVTAQLLIPVPIQEGFRTPTWLLQQLAFRPDSGLIRALLSAPECPEAAFSIFPPLLANPGRSSALESCSNLWQQLQSPPLPVHTMFSCHKHMSFLGFSIAWDMLGAGADSCNCRFLCCWGWFFLPFSILGQAKAPGFH